MKDEIFGPILPLHYYTNIEALVEEINSRPKPLSVYLFSENSKNIKMVENRTSSGAFVINDAMIQNFSVYLPFGGVGASGYGRYHGEEGFKNFSNRKSVLHTKSSLMFPNRMRFPPYD